MQFLDRFPRAESARLLDVGHRMRLRRGDYLMRRGDKGGDLYLVETGALEVVDTRSRPEIVLDVLGPGAIVGEMAFMDESPRAADVRATVDTVCRWWDHAQLLQVLEGDAVFAASFYRALSAAVVERARSVTTTAVTGGMGRRSRVARSGAGEHVLQIRESAVRTRSRWFRADTQLRREPLHAGARAEIHDAVSELTLDLERWLASLGDPELQLDLGPTLQQELHPYLSRSRTGSLLLAEPDARLEVRVHVLSGKPEGEGAFGEELDRALLGLPTFRSLRRRQDRVVRHLREMLAQRALGQVLVLNGAASGLVPSLLGLVAPHGTVVTCLEGDRDALGLLGLLDPKGEVRFVQDDLLRVCLGRSAMHHEPQDLILVDGLVEHLPDRLTAALFHWCHDRLTPGGTLLVTALQRDDDAVLVDHLLGWPTVRRTDQALVQLVEAAGLSDARAIEAAGEVTLGLVVTGVAGIRGLARQELEA